MDDVEKTVEQLEELPLAERARVLAELVEDLERRLEDTAGNPDPSRQSTEQS